MIDIQNALKIQGCMEPAELMWLARQASEHERIVEVGSFLGRSTRAMADNTPGWVIAFDDWFGPRDIDLDSRERIYGVFRKNMNGLIESQKVRVLQGNHGDLSIIPRGLHPDMVFIDGSHEYEHAKRDMVVWRELISQGGLLCGHDAQLPGVKRALEEILPNYESIYFTGVETVMWVA